MLSSLRTAEEIRGIDEAGAGLSPSRPGSMTRQYLCPLAAASMRADLRVGTAIARSGAPRVDIARIGGVRQA